MATNLGDLVRGYLTPDVLERAASFAGASPAGTEKAVAAAVPAVIGALAEMASNRTGAEQIGRMLDTGKFDGSTLSNPAGFFAGSSTTPSIAEAGKGVVDSVFGGKASGVSDLIARSAGIGSGSASTLLGFAAGLVMNVLGRQRTSMGLDASGLLALLTSQVPLLAGRLPAGLWSLLGWRTAGLGAAAETAGALKEAWVGPGTEPSGVKEAWVGPGTEPSGLKEAWVGPAPRRNWLPLGILAALVLAGLAYFGSRHPAPQPAPVPQATQAPAPTPAPQPATPTPAPQATPPAPTPTPQATPPTPTPAAQAPSSCTATITAPPGSIAMGLAQWIRNSTVTTKRFVFAHINFETGSATITPGSVQTLTGLASVLKCYPSARVELDGYTDSTGNPAANQKLSMDRADAVKDLLVKNGVEESRISTKGFGETHPLASNATATGRAENRRTEMVVER